VKNFLRALLSLPSTAQRDGGADRVNLAHLASEMGNRHGKAVRSTVLAFVRVGVPLLGVFMMIVGQLCASLADWERGELQTERPSMARIKQIIEQGCGRPLAREDREQCVSAHPELRHYEIALLVRASYVEVARWCNRSNRTLALVGSLDEDLRREALDGMRTDFDRILGREQADDGLCATVEADLMRHVGLSLDDAQVLDAVVSRPMMTQRTYDDVLVRKAAQAAHWRRFRNIGLVVLVGFVMLLIGMSTVARRQ
jgi:hypothetical protein